MVEETGEAGDSKLEFDSAGRGGYMSPNMLTLPSVCGSLARMRGVGTCYRLWCVPSRRQTLGEESCGNEPRTPLYRPDVCIYRCHRMGINVGDGQTLQLGLFGSVSHTHQSHHFFHADWVPSYVLRHNNSPSSVEFQRLQSGCTRAGRG